MLHVEVASGDLVACHKLGRMVDINEPRPIIANFYIPVQKLILGTEKVSCWLCKPFERKKSANGGEAYES